jgi:hypothetical protein
LLEELIGMKVNYLTAKKYKNAFNCKKCPQSLDEDGCPVWAEQIWTDKLSGESIINKGCGFALMQHLLVDVVKQAATAPAEISQMRQEVVESVQKATIATLAFHKAKEEALRSSEADGIVLIETNDNENENGELTHA